MEITPDKTIIDATTENSSTWREIKGVLNYRNFRLLWLGQGISLLGDQFGLIALPWLVLQLTGDAFAMGLVLAIAGIPRALFMLFGGALTDRFSPRTLMLVTNVVRMILVGILAFTILTNVISMWMIYLFALLFGLADAFFFPASSAMVPTILPKQQLQIGNSITQGTAQLSVFLGPVLAGFIIALFAGEHVGGETVPNLQGIGIALAFDAVTFLASALTLKLMSDGKKHAGDSEEVKNVLAAIREGLAFVWQDDTLRTVFLVVAAIAVLTIAPINLGVPVIADDRLNGAADYGILMSAYGAGSLIGIILSGVLPRLSERRQGSILFSAVAMVGLFTVGLALSQTIWIASLFLALSGIFDGWVMIQFTTWLQLRTPEALLGRIMGLLMFSFVGLAPVADALFGWLIEWNVTAVLIFSGLVMTAISLFAALQPSIRNMGAASTELS